LAQRRLLPDGAIRLLIEKTDAERASEEGNKTVEYWSGSRRLLYTPCSDTDVYIALTMLDSDLAARRVPLDRAEWTRSFPRLDALIARLGDDARYDRFEVLRLKRWSAGKVALIGDAAHALPPNLGQGGGFAMMNALSLAVYLDRHADVADALARTLFFALAGKWLVRQRRRVAASRPTGTAA
jgi:2-polyprenyl-6-methoxyphenol hydroxylase-like FAD-dependent oxidoreductase